MISFTPEFHTTSDGYDPPDITYSTQRGEIYLLPNDSGVVECAFISVRVHGVLNDFNGIEGAFCVSGIPSTYKPKYDTGLTIRDHSSTIGNWAYRYTLDGRARGGGTTIRIDSSGPGVSTSRVDWTDAQGNPLHISLGEIWITCDGVYPLKTPISP